MALRNFLLRVCIQVVYKALGALCVSCILCWRVCVCIRKVSVTSGARVAIAAFVHSLCSYGKVVAVVGARLYKNVLTSALKVGLKLLYNW